MYDKHTEANDKGSAKFDKLLKEVNDKKHRPSPEGAGKPSASGLDAAKQIIKNKVRKGLAQ